MTMTTKVSFVFRFNISEVVYPSVDNFIVSSDQLNFITGERVRREFLTKDTEVSRRIQKFIDDGELIPKEYWWPFWTGLLKRDSHNIYTAFIGEVEQLKEFEKHIDDEKVSINKIVRLKVNNIDRLVKLAKEKYGKIYDRTDILTQHINEYEAKKDELITYAKTKYKVTVDDFFSEKIEL
jgi:adenylate kinase family enzyme